MKYMRLVLALNDLMLPFAITQILAGELPAMIAATLIADISLRGSWAKGEISAWAKGEPPCHPPSSEHDPT